jgi:hypothetical protein
LIAAGRTSWRLSIHPIKQTRLSIDSWLNSSAKPPERRLLAP